MTGRSGKRTRHRGGEGRSHYERTHSDEGRTHTTEKTERNRDTTGTLSPSSGVKRTNIDAHDNNDDKFEQVDSRAIYDTNKEEIDEWYDADYSRKKGIGPFGKMLRSNHRWYQKVAAWMKYKGVSRSPKKKRKLNDGSPISGEINEARLLRPHHKRYPGDLVAVPEYPFDSLEEYTPMENGHYACSHVHLEPPKQCCTIGLSKESKRQAIKKDLLRWKGRVEKLVDRRQLDKHHMTWTDWTVRELRKKHQKALWDQQEQKKHADMARKRREAGRQEAREREFVDSSTQDTYQQQHRRTYRTEQERDHERQPSAPSTPADISPVATPAPQLESPMHVQRLIAPMRRRSDPSAAAGAQVAFLTHVARSKPRLLRSHEALYHDAQYRENLKDQPDFVLLRKWYLAYFLEQRCQPLTVEQRTLLESGDPSHDGKKRFSDVRPIERVDELFGEYIQAAKRERDAQQMQQQLEASFAVKQQAVRMASSIRNQPSMTSRISAKLSAQADMYNFDDVFQVNEVLTTITPDTEAVLHAPFEIWGYDRLDRELDRILDIRPGYTRRPVVQTDEPLSRDTTMMRNEVSYLSEMPRAFATGNPAVDDDMQKLLKYAYQAESRLQQHRSDGGHLLHQTFEDSMSNRQRRFTYPVTRMRNCIP